jgi:hypothetical protein
MLIPVCDKIEPSKPAKPAPSAESVIASPVPFSSCRTCLRLLSLSHNMPSFSTQHKWGVKNHGPCEAGYVHTKQGATIDCHESISTGRWAGEEKGMLTANEHKVEGSEDICLWRRLPLFHMPGSEEGLL